MTDYLKSRKPGEDGDGFFCRFTFGQFFALLVLEVFTIFFVFYLGARYGPQFLGFQKKGATVIGEAPREEGSPKEAMTTDSPEVAAMAQDLVDKAKTPELKERLAQMLSRPADGKVQPPADVERAELNSEAPAYPAPPSAAQPAAPVAGQQNAGIPGSEEMTEPPVENTKAAPQGQMQMRQAQPAEEVEKGAVRIKSAENAKYSLQVGSYQQMADANSAVEKLKGKGYRAFLMIADIPDRGRWYRVRVGGFASREEAKKYQQQFESQETMQAIVVMNEQ